MYSLYNVYVILVGDIQKMCFSHKWICISSQSEWNCIVFSWLFLFSFQIELLQGKSRGLGDKLP